MLDVSHQTQCPVRSLPCLLDSAGATDTCKSDPQAGPGGESRISYPEPSAHFDSRKHLGVKFSVSSWRKEHGCLRKEEHGCFLDLFHD